MNGSIKFIQPPPNVPKGHRVTALMTWQLVVPRNRSKSPDFEGFCYLCEISLHRLFIWPLIKTGWVQEGGQSSLSFNFNGNSVDRTPLHLWTWWQPQLISVFIDYRVMSKVWRIDWITDIYLHLYLYILYSYHLELNENSSPLICAPLPDQFAQPWFHEM